MLKAELHSMEAESSRIRRTLVFVHSARSLEWVGLQSASDRMSASTYLVVYFTTKVSLFSVIL